MKKAKFKKIGLFSFIIICFTLFLGIAFRNFSGDYLKVSVYLPDELTSMNRILTGAICPTLHYVYDDLKKEGFEVIKANSTPESLLYLQNELVDFAICSRKAFFDEPRFSYKVIGDGYAFISGSEMVIAFESMEEYNYFTDISTDEIILNFPNLASANIKQVSNVYDYIDFGIVITSVDNADYEKGELVFVFKENGKRAPLTWAPVLFW